MTDKNIQESEVADKSSEKRAQISLKMIQLRMKQNKERASLAAQKKSLQKEETMTESFSASQIAALKAEYSKINGIDPASDTYKKLIAMLDRLDLKSLKSLAGAEVKFVSKLAQNRVMRKSMKKEEVEELDELSKTTLGSYAKKATLDAVMRSLKAGTKGDHKQAEKAGNRYGNVVKAVDRMTKEEVESIDELSTNKLADYKKKAGADASAADKAGDMKRGNKRFSGIMKATRKQFGNDSKKEVTEMDNTDSHSGPEREVNPVTNKKRIVYKRHEKKDVKTEELSPKQKEIDKNKNGKIDGFDLAHLRKKNEELSPKQKELDKNKNGKIDGTDLAHLRSKKKLPQGADFAAQRRKERMASTGRMDEEDIQEAITVKKEKYSWGKMMTVHHGSDTSYPLHPEHQQAIAKLKPGEKTSFKDETNSSVHAYRDGDTVHLTRPRTSSTKTSVAHSHFTEEVEFDLDEEVKVGDKVSFNHPMKAIPGKTMKKVGTVHKVEDDTVHVKVKDKYGVITHKKSASELTKEEFDLGEESINEKSDYEVYHKDYSGAVQAAIKQAEKRGYEVDMDDWHDKVATGPKKPSSGKTNSFSVNLMKDGKPSKKKLQMQVYNMDNHKYELNMYIEEVQQGVAEGSDYTPPKLGTVKANLMNTQKPTVQVQVFKRNTLRGDSYWVTKEVKTFKTMDQGQAYVDRINKKGVAEETLSELNKDTLHSYAKKSEKDQDDQFDKIGKGIRDKDPKSANKAGHKFSMRSIGQNRAEKRLAKEAASPAQQAAIAIAMKKAGKEPKDRLPKKPADEYDRKVVKYLKKKHGMSEGIVDKIKAIKRGMQAKAKADDHFDKAGDPKNANASKDLKKAVRYHNLVNKEEVVLEAKKPKSFKDVKKKMKEEEKPNKSTVKKGDDLTGKKEPIEINPEIKESKNDE